MIFRSNKQRNIGEVCPGLLRLRIEDEGSVQPVMVIRKATPEEYRLWCEQEGIDTSTWSETPPKGVYFYEISTD